MKTRHLSLLLAALLLPDVAVSDDAAVYESLPEVSVGKVFFSPSERERFDKRRGDPAIEKRGRQGNSSKPRRSIDANAAGYWISSRGLSKVYEAGDFVARSGVTDEGFPGDVLVENSVPGESDDSGDSGDSGDSDESDDGAK